MFFHCLRRVELTTEQIVAEVHYAAEEYSWFAVGFSNYGELKPADYCVLWLDWHRETHLEVNYSINSSMMVFVNYK